MVLIQSIVSYIGGGIGTVKKVFVKGFPGKRNIIVGRADANIALPSGILGSGIAVSRLVEDGCDGKFGRLQFSSMLHPDPVAHPDAFLPGHVLLHCRFPGAGRQHTFQNHRQIHGIQQRMGFHQDFSGTVSGIRKHHGRIAALHRVYPIPAGNGRDILFRDPVRTGNLQTLEPVFHKIAVGFVQNCLGSRLVTQVDGNGGGCHHGNRQKGNQIFLYGSKQIDCLGFSHYQTNSLALAG